MICLSLNFTQQKLIRLPQTRSEIQSWIQLKMLKIGNVGDFSQNSYSLMSYPIHPIWGEWPSGLYNFHQATEVKLGQVRSNSGWVTSEA